MDQYLPLSSRDLFYSTGQFLKRPRCHPRESEALLHGSLMSFPRRRESRKKV
ncbi:MAG TPA: hypothetical protein LFV92_05800 [Rickettsia endosymbiont of Ceroptres masudai]|nr:hypothetical protein [Rickettsia endosymbiont of Ceroptres masudai]